MSDSLRVITLVDRGVQAAKTLNNDPKSQSEPYQNLGTIYQNLDKLDHDDSLLRNALEERKSVFVADSPEAAETLVALRLLRVRKVNLKKQSDLSVKAWRLICRLPD